MVTLAILYVLCGLLSPLRSPSLINCTSCFHPFWVGKRGFVLFFRSLNNEKFNEAPIGRRSVKNLCAWLVGIKSPNFPSELGGVWYKMKLATISQTQGVGGSVSQQRGEFWSNDDDSVCWQSALMVSNKGESSVVHRSN